MKHTHQIPDNSCNIALNVCHYKFSSRSHRHRVRFLQSPVTLLDRVSFKRNWGFEVWRNSVLYRNVKVKGCFAAPGGMFKIWQGVKIFIAGEGMSQTWGVLTARAREFRSSWRRDICFCDKIRQSELQWSSLQYTREVAIADAVLRSRVWLMRRK